MWALSIYFIIGVAVLAVCQPLLHDNRVSVQVRLVAYPLVIIGWPLLLAVLCFIYLMAYFYENDD